MVHRKLPYHTSHGQYFVFDLDTEGEPTSTILYSQTNVPNKDMEWSSFEFPEPINAPNGYMLALSYEGHVGLGLDTGEGPDYPFTEKQIVSQRITRPESSLIRKNTISNVL